jgi:hypothetical protein
MIFDNKEKSVKKFAILIGKMEAKDFIALAQALGVKIFYDSSDGLEKPQPRSSESIIEDALVKFYALDRGARRYILKIAKNSLKHRSKKK